MKFLNYIVLGLLALSSQPGFARNFYRTSFYLAADYANIDTGSEVMFNGKDITIHYSDDKAFCRIYFEESEYPCSIPQFQNTVSYPVVKIQRNLLLMMFNHFAQVSAASEKAKNGFCRLISKLPDGFDLHLDNSFSYQIYDELPESIHVRIGSLRRGVQI